MHPRLCYDMICLWSDITVWPSDIVPYTPSVNMILDAQESLLVYSRLMGMCDESYLDLRDYAFGDFTKNNYFRYSCFVVICDPSLLCRGGGVTTNGIRALGSIL
nr:hypothetical protein [Tanacetum cinerariifolium]